jgi:4-hydroxy-4-methyl-2-oxoglutarate aldolase
MGNRRPLTVVGVLAASAALAAAQQTPARPSADELRRGWNAIETSTYSAADDEAVLKAFAGLRVADVSDGMDAVGLQNVGLMDPAIHALWKDTNDYRHRMSGIAITARYVPTNRPAAGHRPPADFDDWVGDWYTRLSDEPFVPLIREGSVLVMEDAGRRDVGSIGSNNILAWKSRGLVGVVTDATARDTDEIIAQSVPLYYRGPGRGIRPGRNEIESINRPVVCGGVLVMPGDVVVADGDGVIVVPRAQALQVAQYAQAILEADKAGRRRLYESLGMPKDKSVQ